MPLFLGLPNSNHFKKHQGVIRGRSLERYVATHFWWFAADKGVCNLSFCAPWQSRERPSCFHCHAEAGSRFLSSSCYHANNNTVVSVSITRLQLSFGSLGVKARKQKLWKTLLNRKASWQPDRKVRFLTVNGLHFFKLSVLLQSRSFKKEVFPVFTFFFKVFIIFY